MTPLASSAVAATVVSLCSLTGCATLLGRRRGLDRLAGHLTDLAAGGFLATSLLDLMPEAVKDSGLGIALVLGLTGFVLFEVVNRLMPGHSHAHAPCDEHARPVSVATVVVGDGLHNFTDGVALAAAFTVGPEVGLTVTLATIMHEIPQELGDFGLLIANGMGAWRALWLNLASGLTAVLGAVLGSLFAASTEHAAGPLHAIVAGGFAYMAWAIGSHHGLGRYLRSRHALVAALGFALVTLVSHV
jgi:zinc and cadmium transporter